MGNIVPFDLAIFLIGAFAAAFVTGLAGFAFAMVATAIWLHALTPIQATALIAAYALLVQGYAVWKLRHALNVRRLIPFIVGLPALIAGTWLGWKLYGRLDEATFRKAVLYLLLVSGLALVTTWR
jgi:uncharacterized membrane protein YfcA